MRAIILALIGAMIGSVAHANEYTLPSGAIIAFDLEECPEGWAEYEWAAGHFLIGAGQGEHGFVFQQGARGGRSIHRHSADTGKAEGYHWRLLVDENGQEGWENYFPGRKHSHGFETDQRDHYPPYVAVMFCKRL